jgi:hypothetical protein
VRTGRHVRRRRTRGYTQVGVLTTEAASLRPLFHSPLVAAFLDAVPSLPHITPRTVLCDSSRTHYWTETEAAALPDTQRARLVTRRLDESFYYVTRYGSPLAYARPLEILSQAGLASVRGRRIADFGYGTIGHLRLLAAIGADVHGIEVDPLLRALYENDRGPVAGGKGSIALHHGQWPAEPGLVAEVGDGYDLFISKNTLKRGYVHPAEQVNPRMLVHLGVDDSAYVAALARTVKPGGLMMIYNLCPLPHHPASPTFRGPTAGVPSIGLCWNARASRSWSTTATIRLPHMRWRMRSVGTLAIIRWIWRRTSSRPTRCCDGARSSLHGSSPMLRSPSRGRPRHRQPPSTTLRSLRPSHAAEITP